MFSTVSQPDSISAHILYLAMAWATTPCSFRVCFFLDGIHGNRLPHFPELRFWRTRKALFKNAQAKDFQFRCMPHVHWSYGLERVNSEINGKHD